MPVIDMAMKLFELERRCHQLGLTVTVQRRATLKALVDRRDHPTAEAVYTDVVRELPGVSKATVYRTLDNLVRLGLARRVHHDGSAARFDGYVERHHHLHCLECDSITDVDWDSRHVSALAELNPDAPQDFEVLEVSVSFQGICRRCTENKPQ